jgi:predicted RNA methylase
MSGFSPDWLNLREPVDHRSRNPRLAGRVGAAFARHGQVRVVDLGCGTGSNLRATSLLLPSRQSWTLVDHDPRLLTAARETLRRWADQATGDGDGLVLHKGSRRLDVAFRQADLNVDLDAALGPETVRSPDLVTASAFFDLCSPAFIARLATAVARRRASFYTVLTYDGDQLWTPPNASDAAMTAAFHAHQANDKGFGAASGPAAPGHLASAFRAGGYSVESAKSPWRRGRSYRYICLGGVMTPRTWCGRWDLNPHSIAGAGF